MMKVKALSRRHCDALVVVALVVKAAQRISGFWSGTAPGSPCTSAAAATPPSDFADVSRTSRNP
jgi:hypothetical protein